MAIVIILIQQFLEHPIQMLLEIALIAVVTYMVMQLNRRKKAAALKQESTAMMPSLEEQERRLAAFQSIPFHTDSTVTSIVPVEEFKGQMEVASRSGCHVCVTGGVFSEVTECLDLATYDYHSLSTNPRVVEVARNTVVSYGVGSCGPRAFYGTVKPHLDVEADLAAFLETEDAVVYSFAYATTSTLISCYASKGDFLICDEGVSSSVREGCSLARTNLQYYRHSDMAHLEEQIKAVVAKEDPRKPHRRFVVTEGVFKNGGDLCNLPEILRLCRQYKFRLLLEDSYGFGALGKTGRGTPEHFGITTSEIDVYVGSLSTSLGAVGGFCAGDSNMTDFQRLGAAAYIFSASLPPYMTASASTSLKILEEETHHVEALKRNIALVHKELRAVDLNPERIVLTNTTLGESPLVILQVPDAYVKAQSLKAIQNKLQRVVNAVAEEKVLILRHVYDTEEAVLNRPALRIVVKSSIPEEELKSAMTVIIKALKAEFS